MKEQNGQKTSTIKMIISVGKKLMGVGIWRRQEQERVQRIESWRCFLAVWFILTDFVPSLWISETTVSLEMFWINHAISIKKIFFHHVIRYCIITLFQPRSCVYIYLRGNCYVRFLFTRFSTHLIFRNFLSDFFQNCFLLKTFKEMYEKNLR